jgi:hypothetical protein
MPSGDTQAMALEMAMAGPSLFAIRDIDSHYRVNGLAGRFSEGWLWSAIPYFAMRHVALSADVASIWRRSTSWRPGCSMPNLDIYEKKNAFLTEPDWWSFGIGAAAQPCPPACTQEDFPHFLNYCDLP